MKTVIVEKEDFEEQTLVEEIDKAFKDLAEGKFEEI